MKATSPFMRYLKINTSGTNKMKAFIFSGGAILAEGIEERPSDGDMVICADSGYNNAVKMGAKVNILIGDFDSLSKIPPDVDEVLQLPPEKDATDTQLAVEVAIDRGADEIIIIGSTSGRLDHTLSTLAILEDLYSRRVPACIVNGQNRIRYIRDSGTIVLRSQYKYFSVIALDTKVKKVSIEGAKYPMMNKDLGRARQFAVSNEIVKNCAMITVKKGAVYIIESRDI